MNEILPRRPLVIGAKAPIFSMRTTQGMRTLTDYAGEWLVLFSHPADFTPVCTSEIISFSRMAAEFDAIGCALLGLSVDSLHAHLAWVQAIEREFDVKVPFPIAEDPSMAVAHAYGMIDETAASSATVRSTFIIDPEGVIRAISAYPMTTGRNVAEIKRLVEALQLADAEGVLTPEGWRPGGPVIDADDALTATSLPPDWFFRLKEEKAS